LCAANVHTSTPLVLWAPRIPPSPLAGDDNAPLPADADAAGRALYLEASNEDSERLYTRKGAACVRGRTPAGHAACPSWAAHARLPTHAAAPWTAGYETIDRVQVQMKGKAPRVLPIMLRQPVAPKAPAA